MDNGSNASHAAFHAVMGLSSRFSSESLAGAAPPHHGVPAGWLAWAETLDLIVIALWLCRVTEDEICEVAMYRIPFTVSE